MHVSGGMLYRCIYGPELHARVSILFNHLIDGYCH